MLTYFVPTNYHPLTGKGLPFLVLYSQPPTQKVVERWCLRGVCWVNDLSPCPESPLSWGMRGDLIPGSESGNLGFHSPLCYLDRIPLLSGLSSPICSTGFVLPTPQIVLRTDFLNDASQKLSTLKLHWKTWPTLPVFWNSQGTLDMASSIKNCKQETRLTSLNTDCPIPGPCPQQHGCCLVEHMWGHSLLFIVYFLCPGLSAHLHTGWLGWGASSSCLGKRACADVHTVWTCPVSTPHPSHLPGPGGLLLAQSWCTCVRCLPPPCHRQCHPI
jgi:hypothetical protein